MNWKQVKSNKINRVEPSTGNMNSFQYVGEINSRSDIDYEKKKLNLKNKEIKLIPTRYGKYKVYVKSYGETKSKL